MERTDYGTVEVIKGRHKGKIGYYDDDSEEGLAIVYFGEPFKDPYELIRLTSLVKTDKKCEPYEKFKQDQPMVSSFIRCP